MKQNRNAGGTHKQRAPKSPKMRHAMKREAESDERKAKTKIREPKESVKELFGK